MADVDRQAPPDGLQAAGKRLWSDVTGTYDIDVHEQLLLGEACHVADRLARLAAEVTAAPVTITNVRGDLVAHPALVESRLQAVALSRMLASLRLPSGEEDGKLVRPQRRGAARGTYRMRPAG